MCGIVGMFSSNPDLKWIESTVQELIHRGPDHQASISITPEVLMGSTRLAMTDPLPRSNQPFIRKDLGIAISFNGEIYNYKELRVELSKLGYHFESESDTEVLLLGLYEYGGDFTKKLNGMFAFAYFSLQTQSILLGRDCLGKKPLYYFFDGSQFSWSSSIKSLERKYPSSISEDGLIQYLAFGYTIDSDTIFDKVQSVLPGELIEVIKSNGSFSLNKTKILSSRKSITVATVSLRDSLYEAVQSRIDGHQKVAVSLSGGLDSSIIAFIAKDLGAEVTGYSASWPHSDKAKYNTDAERAKIFSKGIGINFCEVPMISPDALEENLVEFVSIFGEPNANPTGISMLALYKQISKDGFRLVLTGDGADEIFGGYPRYRAQSLIPNLFHMDNQLVSKLMSITRNGVGSTLTKILQSQLASSNHHKWSYWHWNMIPSDIRALRKGLNSSAEIDMKISFFVNNYNHSISQNDIASLMQLDRNLWLSMESNRRLDRISMAYSTEARSPFQDDRVMDSASVLPSLRITKEFSKEVLWRAFPEMERFGVRTDKTGFISPVGHWLRSNYEMTRRLAKQSQNSFNFESEFIDKLLLSPDLGNYRGIMKLWSIVILAAWEGSR